MRNRRTSLSHPRREVYVQRVDRTSYSLASFTPVPVSLAYAVEFTARISEQQCCVKWSSDSFSQSFLCTSHEGHMLQDVCHSSSLYESSAPQWRYSDRCICSQKVLLIHQPPSKAVSFHSRNKPGLTLYGKGVCGEGTPRICSEPPVDTSTRMCWSRQRCRQFQLR